MQCRLPSVLFLLIVIINPIDIVADELRSRDKSGKEMTSNNKLRLDHIAIWVEDTAKTSYFLTEIMGWKRHPMEFGVSPEDKTTGGMQGVFFDANGLWLETILPTSPGPGMDILKEKGDGAIVEINFEPDDYQAVIDDMNVRGIGMLNMDGSPLGADGGVIKEGVTDEDGIDEHGQRIAYWPTELSGGTTVEIYEYRENEDQGLLNIRNSMWENEKPDPNSPRTDRLAIIVRDLESTARFYTDVMGLKRHPMKFGVDASTNESVGGMKATFIDANGVWLALVQPVGPGPLMDYLNENGDGHVAELIVEVDDLGAFYEKMKAKGVTLINIDGTPLSDDKKYHVLEPYGDKLAYIPEDVSCGITIEVFERGPRETSLIHQRDDTWNN